MSFKTGLLIATNTKNVGNLFKFVETDTLNTLYIKILSDQKLNALQSSVKTFVSKEASRNIIQNCYCKLKTIENLDVRVLLSNIRDQEMHKVYTSKSIDVIYFDSMYTSNAIEQFVNTYIMSKSQACRLESVSQITDDSVYILNVNEGANSKDYDYVVVGGTFDKLHVGHKILLSEAVLSCKKRLTVGVTSDSILQAKILPDFIDSCTTRKKLVTEFLKDIEPNLEYDVVTIFDVYGPTKTDKSFQMIVVSSETAKGAEKINEFRRSNDLSALTIYTVDIIESLKQADTEESKISSSNIRMRMLGKLLKPPMPRPNLPSIPYIIGLTGGIASGKSAVASHLKVLGCSCINCDEMGHNIYEIGSRAYNFIKETFGSEVFNEDGSVNRSQLATIVFNNQDMLNKLNNCLWPLILERIKEEIITKYNRDTVVIVEAALLIQANWINECHEIWTCIVPPEEAIKRLQQRNNLSLQEAQVRLKALPENEFYITHSNVVFSTLWDSNYTKQQVEKAWYQLRERLPVIG